MIRILCLLGIHRWVDTGKTRLGSGPQGVWDYPVARCKWCGREKLRPYRRAELRSK